VTWSLPRPG